MKTEWFGISDAEMPWVVAAVVVIAIVAYLMHYSI